MARYQFDVRWPIPITSLLIKRVTLFGLGGQISWADTIGHRCCSYHNSESRLVHSLDSGRLFSFFFFFLFLPLLIIRFIIYISAICHGATSDVFNSASRAFNNASPIINPTSLNRWQGFG